MRLSLTKGPRPPSRGVVFAVSGAKYTCLAQRSARTLRQVMPGVAIDVFTDQPLQDPVFDRIWPLEKSWFRPKMEAMRRSRFRDTLLLDADIVALTDVSEMFGLATRYELLACQAMSRPWFIRNGQADIPLCYPILNSGVLVFRRSRAITRLAHLWESQVRDNNAAYDQPALRRLCYDCNIRIGILPPEYNVIHLPNLTVWSPDMGPPRLLHVRSLHAQDPGDPTQPFDLAKAIGPDLVQRIAGLLGQEAHQPKPGASQRWTRTTRFGRALRRLWWLWGPHRRSRP